MTKRVLDFDDENGGGAEKGDGKEGKVKFSKLEKKRISEGESSEKKEKKRVKGSSEEVFDEMLKRKSATMSIIIIMRGGACYCVFFLLLPPLAIAFLDSLSCGCFPSVYVKSAGVNPDSSSELQGGLVPADNESDPPRKSKKMAPLYRVMLHNDNYNKREYVVQVLMKVIPGMTLDIAVNLMQEAHHMLPQKYR
ncbi:hypothetical protein AgCh_034020 [Apium graveolens]